MKHPLLSIVVPTKDRYFYLKKLIQLIDSFQFGDEVEMVIQDNTADNREIVDFLADEKYAFVVYDYYSEQLPVSLNSDKAILNSSGEYICFIGDDDGVTKYILEGVKWMKANGIEAAKPAETHYLWPDAINAINVSEAAVVKYRKFTGCVKYLFAYDELLRTLKAGIPDRGNMPLAYHGIVSRKVMDKVYSICGTYFPGNSPDIANGAALSLIVNKYALVDLPWAIYGSCVSKGGGERMPGKSFPPKISDIAHWPKDAEEKWYPKIPKVAIWVTIWPESVISALKKMGREDLIKHFNIYIFYARFILHYPKLKSYVYEVCQNMLRLKLTYCVLVIHKYVTALLRRICWFAGINKPYSITNVETINDAARVLETLSDGTIK